MQNLARPRQAALGRPFQTASLATLRTESGRVADIPVAISHTGLMLSKKTLIYGSIACALTLGLIGGPATAAVNAPVGVTADAQTVSVTHSRDAADDPAIWVDPSKPSNSLILGNDKQGALEVYNLSGSLRQRITSSSSAWGNVDLRQDVKLGGRSIDLVAAANKGVRLFTVNRATRQLAPATKGSKSLRGGGQGICMYTSPKTGAVFVFTVNGKGTVRQWEVIDPDGDGLLDMKKVREILVVTGVPPREATESCAVDDANGALYIAEAKVALWRYGAEPSSGSQRTVVDRVRPAGNLVPDIEGITVAGSGSSGQVIASAQNIAAPNSSYFTVYDRISGKYEGSFRIVGGPKSDGCERTDGIAAYAGNLGPSYPKGLFVCQDNKSTAPVPGNQNFKLTRWDRILDSL